MTPMRLLLADDQAMIRTGFRLVLAPQRDIHVVGEAADGAQAVDLVERLHPDVVLMDVRMPRMDGITATRHIVSVHPATRVLILTTFDLDEYVIDALNAGASGFLLKDASAPELLAAVRAVHAGDAVVAPAATRRLLDTILPLRPHTDRTALEQLSAREEQIVTLIARGLSNAAIAGELFIAESTVKTHINRILAKLNARDRVHLVILAYESGLVRSRAADAGPPPAGL